MKINKWLERFVDGNTIKCQLEYDALTRSGSYEIEMYQGQHISYSSLVIAIGSNSCKDVTLIELEDELSKHLSRTYNFNYYDMICKTMVLEDTQPFGDRSFKTTLSLRFLSDNIAAYGVCSIENDDDSIVIYNKDYTGSSESNIITEFIRDVKDLLNVNLINWK